MKIVNQKKEVVVSVCIITYNQAEIIGQVLDYVLQQQTDFKYEIVIGEDCSTDNTLEICKKYANQYPDIINLIAHPNNLGLIGNFIETIGNCQGKYIALCAGDDYWIDPQKLEAQVNFLERNESFSMVATEIFYNSFNANKNVKQFLAITINNLVLSGLSKTLEIFKLYFNNEDEFWNRRRTKFNSKRPEENDLRSFLKDIQYPRYYPASTILVRRKVIESLPEKALKIWSAEHLPVILWSALNGKIKLLRAVTVLKNTTSFSVSVSKVHLTSYKKDNLTNRLIELLELANLNTNDYNSKCINETISSLKN